MSLKEPIVEGAYYELKTVNPFFTAVRNGEKTAELRFNDRGYAVGDILSLREWDSETGYSGQCVVVFVTHVLKEFDGLAPGWALLSFRRSDTYLVPTDPAEVVAELRRLEQVAMSVHEERKDDHQCVYYGEAHGFGAAADLVAKKLGVK